jgi:uncharacterized protein YlxW (UPF0749 family)|tara:strand:- start:691 stop:906 length:216 start_codon:yes stop_codon:yes gene_type:complete
MLQGIIIKKIISLVMKQLLKQVPLEKFDKVLNYVEKPNDLDKKVNTLQKKLNKLEKNLKGVKDRFGKDARF